VVPYAMKDTEFTLRLYERLAPKLPDSLQELYQQEVAVALALLDVEAAGIGLDVPYLEKTASAYGVKLMRLDKALQKLAATPTGSLFNPNSPKQVMEAFERRGIALSKTDKATLKTLDDDLAKTLLEYRNIKKMHATYLVGMLAEQKDGVIHPNFNTTLPRTGRMSSSAASNN
jgi:DNA polymerase I-like protein with 3'-5' exonuclease and polymerase domains